MIQMKYRAFAAVAIVSGVSLTPAAPLTRHSLTSSMISAAMAKFHGVKDPSHGSFRMVATAVQVPAQNKSGDPKPADPKTSDQGPITADVTPLKPAQEPIKADVKPVKQGDQGAVQATVTPAVKAPPAPTKVAEAKVPDAKPAEEKPAPKSADQKTPAATPVKGAPTNGLVSNVFVDAEIRSVINDVSSLAGVTIIGDDTIKEQTVTIEFKNEPIDSVVEKLALITGAYSKQQSPGVYIISKATVESAFFQKFAETRIYSVQNQTAASIQALLNASYKPYLSVDPKTNTIGVCAPKQLADKILADIQKADRPGRQIYVEALVTEISAEDGLNTSFNGSHGKWSLGANLGIITQAAGFADLAQINALITDHKMKLRANPHLIATAGLESTVNVGQDTYYSILSGSTIYPTSQIQLIHTGVVLKFTATIGDDGLITMQLAPSVSDAVVNVNGNPTSNIRTADTRVRVKSGETIMIAGLTQETGDKQVVRVPLLGYIPLVGELFTQRNTTKKKVETVFLITPRILDPK